MTVTHELLVDAVVGAGFPSCEFADKAEKAGLARNVGNQYVMRWEWDRIALGKASADELHKLYTKIKELNHAD